jgi:hypothetical protein
MVIDQRETHGRWYSRSVRSDEWTAGVEARQTLDMKRLKM